MESLCSGSRRDFFNFFWWVQVVAGIPEAPSSLPAHQWQNRSKCSRVRGNAPAEGSRDAAEARALADHSQSAQHYATSLSGLRGEIAQLKHLMARPDGLQSAATAPPTLPSISAASDAPCEAPPVPRAWEAQRCLSRAPACRPTPELSTSSWKASADPQAELGRRVVECGFLSLLLASWLPLLEERWPGTPGPGSTGWVTARSLREAMCIARLHEP